MHVAFAGEVFHSGGNVSTELEQFCWKEGQLRVCVDLRPVEGGGMRGELLYIMIVCVYKEVAEWLESCLW